MKTISSAVSEYIKSKPFLSSALSDGIINLTSLSRIIKPDIEEILRKNINHGAIVMALNRLSVNLEFQHTQKIARVIKKIGDIIENSKTVLWNGPAFYFENPNFALGSYEIAKMIIKKNKDNSIFSVAGGGDTIAVLNQINAIRDFNFVSTAGGAFLEYLEGKELPGIKALN